MNGYAHGHVGVDIGFKS